MLKRQEEANSQFLPADPGNTKLIADVEQFLYYHRIADLTAEVLHVRLLLAILKLLGSRTEH